MKADKVSKVFIASIQLNIRMTSTPRVLDTVKLGDVTYFRCLRCEGNPRHFATTQSVRRHLLGKHSLTISKLSKDKDLTSATIEEAPEEKIQAAKVYSEKSKEYEQTKRKKGNNKAEEESDTRGEEEKLICRMESKIVAMKRNNEKDRETSDRGKRVKKTDRDSSECSEGSVRKEVASGGPVKTGEEENDVDKQMRTMTREEKDKMLMELLRKETEKGEKSAKDSANSVEGREEWIQEQAGAGQELLGKYKELQTVQKGKDGESTDKVREISRAPSKPETSKRAGTQIEKSIAMGESADSGKDNQVSELVKGNVGLKGVRRDLSIVLERNLEKQAKELCGKVSEQMDVVAAKELQAIVLEKV